MVRWWKNGRHRERVINSVLLVDGQELIIVDNGNSISVVSDSVPRNSPLLSTLSSNKTNKTPSVSVIIAGILGFVARHFANLSTTSTTNSTTLLSEGLPAPLSSPNLHFVYRHPIMFQHHDRNKPKFIPPTRHKPPIHNCKQPCHATRKLPHRTPFNRKPVQLSPRRFRRLRSKKSSHSIWKHSPPPLCIHLLQGL